MRLLLFITLVTSAGCSSSSTPPAPPVAQAVPTQKDTDAAVEKRVKEELAKRGAEQRKAAATADTTADELRALIQSIKRTELAQVEEEAVAYERRLLDGKEPFPTDAQLKNIARWDVPGRNEFRSGNSVFALYGKVRLDAGYVAAVKADRMRGALDNSDFFNVVLNGYKKYPGLQTCADLVAGAELFGTGFPLVKRADVIFAVKGHVLYCDEDEDNMIRRVVSNVYKKEMTTEPYRNAPK